jgi:general secretion pathway protein H
MNAGVRKYDRAAGFTLLELILVMLILSTVLALAGPSLRGFFTSRKTHDTAAQILSLTQYARSQAICEGIVYRLNFDTLGRTYWLTAQEAGVFEKLETEFGQIFELPSDIVMELDDLDQGEGKTFLKFTPQGTVTAGTVRLIDRNGRALKITSPTVTESFAIVECEQGKDYYASYASKQSR